MGVKILERTGVDILECMGAIIGICTKAEYEATLAKFFAVNSPLDSPMTESENSCV